MAIIIWQLGACGIWDGDLEELQEHLLDFVEKVLISVSTGEYLHRSVERFALIS